MKKILRFAGFAATFVLLTAIITSCSTTPYKIIKDGVVVCVVNKAENQKVSVRLQVVNEKVVHVTAVPGTEFSDIESLMAVKQPSNKTPFTIEGSDSIVKLKTSKLTAEVSVKTGEVRFGDSTGKLILAEKTGGGKTFTPVEIQGKKYLAIRQQFESPDDEAIYGLGENQTNILNLKGKDADLFQYNTQAVVPFFVSSRNYGILWDNYSRTKFGDPREYEDISGLTLTGKDGSPGGLTATYFTDKKNLKKIFTERTEKEISYQFIPDLVKFPKDFKLQDGAASWEGTIESQTAGLHKFIFTSAGYSKLWIDGILLIDRWRQCWNTCSIYFDLPMEADAKHHLKIEWIPDGGESFIALKHLPPQAVNEQNRITLSSEVADQIDYYFMAGDNMDEVISGYRTVTGKAVLMPKWAMGFWQSRERYKTQDEILGVVNEFRQRHIPIDNIVLDWQYWPIDKWGDHEFEKTRFTDPVAMMKTLHDTLHTQLMISVWAKYYKGTNNYNRMDKKGWLYKLNIEKDRKDWLGYVSTFYDAYNADARKDFWDQINKALYSKGVDAWWLDATEPDITSNLPMDERKALMNPTALGPSDKYFNAFSLMQTEGIYNGQREVNPNQRVYILTRSGFAGLQRHAAATWSGDIASRWHDMKSQIPCGVSFSMSGIPYWTMDIGGFAVENRYYNPTIADLDEWRELQTRWLQFGTFCPIFRVHGQFPFREMFNIAPESHPAYKAMVNFDKIRYRLMPYIYSLAGQAYLKDYTIMRGLVMDFGSDKNVINIADQFMLGPALMISPVTEYKARSRSVYLPSGCGWYDFFNGKYYNGGQNVTIPAPYESIPVLVKEGSILPAGPEMEYTSQKPTDPLKIFVFTGKNGMFTLYEDEGTNYNYEKGNYSLINFRYDDSKRELTVNDRIGSFDGMLEKRNIQIVVIDKAKLAKVDFDAVPTKSFLYEGKALTVKI